MKLIVGLGNPGKQYQQTRHNVGFMIIDFLADHFQTKVQQNKFNGQFVKLKYHNQDIILLMPLTYMNLSGDCVQQFVNYFKITSDNILVIHDEIDLNFGKLQFKNTGSAAGHNGLKDIMAKTNFSTLARLRIGVGKNSLFSTADWVLSVFSGEEIKTINDNSQLLVTSVLDWINTSNFNLLMNKYNNKQLIKE